MFSSSEWYKEDIEYTAGFNIGWDKLENTSILITGATGLIGTVLIDTLMHKNKTDSLNVKVYALARDKEKILSHFKDYPSDELFEAVQGDITEKIIINETIDYIINLAGNTHPALYASEPIKTIDSIVTGTKNILELASTQKTKRVVNASSVEVYGENRGDTEMFTEDYSGYINCNTLRAGYSEGKRLSEALCQAYIAEKNLDVISARLGRVYGASLAASDSKSTTQFIRSAVNGDDIVLKSEGKQEYSYVYVADAVTAFLMLLTQGVNGEAYNVASDEVKTFRETAELLAAINSKNVTVESPSEAELKGFSVIQKSLMDSSKIKGLGWRAEYDLKSGLERTVHTLREMNDAKT